MSFERSRPSRASKPATARAVEACPRAVRLSEARILPLILEPRRPSTLADDPIAEVARQGHAHPVFGDDDDPKRHGAATQLSPSALQNSPVVSDSR